MAISRKFLQPINLLNAATDPLSAIQGDIYYNTSSDIIKYYDGSQWNDIGGAGGTGIFVSETIPTATEIGEGWFKSSTSELFIWDGTDWVEAISVLKLDILTGTSYPEEPGVDGQLFYNTSNERTSIFFENSWKEFAYADLETLDGGGSSTEVFIGPYRNGGYSASVIESVTEPVSPLVGDIWIDSGSNISYIWSGVDWLSLGGGGGGAVSSVDSRTGDVTLNDLYASITHSSTHESGGSDEILLSQSQVANLSTDLSAKAPLASPTFTGIPAAPTASSGTSTTQIATTAFVTTALSSISSGASVTTSDSAPLSPEVGDMWFETDSGLLYVYYDSYWIEVSGASYMQPQETSMTIALSDEATSITTGTAKLTMRAPFAMTLTKPPRASVSVVSSSGNPSVDINKNGVSIFSTVLSIDAGEKTSFTATTPAVLSTTSIADDEELTFDIDTAGTGTKGLKITIYYEKS